eukprot:3627425-Prymnesium_polylepis.3
MRRKAMHWPTDPSPKVSSSNTCLPFTNAHGARSAVALTVPLSPSRVGRLVPPAWSVEAAAT